MSTPIKLPSSAHAERPVRPRFFGLMKASTVFLAAALLVWRAGHGSARYLAVSALLLVLIGVQFVVGSSGNLAVLVAQVWSTHPARTAD